MSARAGRRLGGLAGEFGFGFGFGVGELAQLGFPSLLKGARDEAVVGVALMKGAFGARVVV